MNIHNNRTLKRFAFGIKENTKILSVIGLAFFLIAAVFGIFWIINPNKNSLEPTIFILGACSTIFFGLPQLAEFILPTRKPIRHMTYDELIQFIQSTDPVNDWHSIDRELVEERFLKEDPRLRIVTKIIDDGIHNDDFREEWANRHPDPNAKSYYYNILFDGNFIHRLILVSVDGHRATLPIPNLQTMRVNSFDFKIAQIFDSLNTLEDYMRRSQIRT